MMIKELLNKAHRFLMGMPNPIVYLKWMWRGKPYVHYNGCMCGLCGKWEQKEYKIAEYKSLGHKWDIVGMCKDCGEGKTELDAELILKP